jgi:hypothetical protein
LDVKGNLKGEFKVDSKNAEGLVNGIDNALSKIAADEADKVRTCLQPVRERLLDVMLPVSPPSGTHEPTAQPKANTPPGQSMAPPIQAVGRVVNVAQGSASARVRIKNLAARPLYVAIEGDKNVSIGNCTRDAASSNISGVGVGTDFVGKRAVWSNSVEIHRALTQIPANGQIIVSFSIPYCQLSDPRETDVFFPLFVSTDAHVGISQNVSTSAPVQRTSQGGVWGQSASPFR